MKIISGIIMIFGISVSIGLYTSSGTIGMSAVQDIELLTVSLITLIGFYIFARALENFNNKNN